MGTSRPGGSDEGGLGAIKRGRFSEEQIIGILKEYKAGRKIAELAREHAVSVATLYGWKSKYGGKQVGEAQRLREA